MSARHFAGNIQPGASAATFRTLTKRKRPKQRDQEKIEKRRKWPWFGDPRRENHGLSLKAAAKKLSGVNRALPLGGLRCFPSVLSGARTMAAAGSGEDPQGQSRRGAHASSARLSRAGLFIPPRETADDSPPHPCPVFPEEKPQLWRRQRPVMRGARPPFHGAITARRGVNCRSLSCHENSVQDRSVAPAILNCVESWDSHRA